MNIITVEFTEEVNQDLLSKGIDIYNEVCRALPFEEINIKLIKDIDVYDKVGRPLPFDDIKLIKDPDSVN